MSVVSDALKVSLDATVLLHGEQITVTNSSDVSATIALAIRGSTVWTNERPRRDVSLQDKSVDWVVERALLVDSSGDTLGTPARGWKVETPDGETFHVMPFGLDKRTFSDLDRDGQTYIRLHTKERNAD